MPQSWDPTRRDFLYNLTKRLETMSEPTHTKEYEMALQQATSAHDIAHANAQVSKELDESAQVVFDAVNTANEAACGCFAEANKALEKQMRALSRAKSLLEKTRHMASVDAERLKSAAEALEKAKTEA